MSCEAWEQRIALHVEGDLEPAGARQVEEHLSACPGCRELAGELRRSQALLKGLNEETVDAAAFTELRERVVSRLETRPRHRWMYAVAAVLLLGAGLSFLLRSRAPEPAPPTIAERRIVEPSVAPAPPLAPPPAKRVRPRTPVKETARKSEPITVKVVTDDPDVVIYWLVDGDGG